MRILLSGLALALLLALSGVARAVTQWDAQDYDLYSGDFNGDGYADILYIAKDPANPSGIALGNSTGEIATGWQTWASNYLGIQWSGNAYQVIVADFNGDGKADILLQSVVPGNHYLLLTSGAGFVIGISQTIPNDSMGLIWSADQHNIVAGDFNGDGRADLFLQATSSTGTDAVILASSAGLFTSTSPAQTWTDGYLGFKWSTQGANVFAGNFNGNSAGRAGLLIQAKPVFVEINYQIPFPVPTYPPNMNGFVAAQSSGTLFTAAGVQAWSRMSNGVDWSPLTNNIVVGTDGAKQAIVVLQAKLTGHTSYELVGNATGALFPAAATALGSNIDLSADTYHLIAGNFGHNATGVGLYYQALTATGTNYLAELAGSATTATAQNPTADTGTVPALAVGRTPGTYAVSSTGTATYSIPIVVPPGIAGIQPKIAITYQSGSGNGLLGAGWGLSGFSQIQRCRRTLAEDGTNGTPQLAAADDYCLNGDKLRYTGGSSYGAPGSTYQLELENFTQVTAYSNGGNPALGPGYWVAQTKDGVKYEYGRTGNAYDNPLAPSNWLLDKVTDRAGNYMIIQYANNSGGLGLEPTQIVYTANDGVGIGAMYTVQFIYQSRAGTDVISHASMAGVQRTINRLQAIQTTFNGAVVRQYNLSYANAGNSPDSRLSAVQECDGGGNCLSPTIISWQDGSAGVLADSTVNIGSLAKYAIPIDVNGDGRADVVYPSSGSSGTWWIMLANPAGGYFAPINTGIQHYGNYWQAIALDYNADGKVDLLVPNGSNQWQVLVSTGSGFTVVPTGFAATGAGGLAWAADVNGDGLPDLVFANASYTQLQARFNSASGFSATLATLYTVPANATIATTSTSSYYSFNYAANTQGDFNGDGRTDLLIGLNVVGVPTPKILISTGTAYVDSGYPFSDSIANGASTVLSTWRALDANEDGFSDLAFVDSGGVWKVAYGGPGATAFATTTSSQSATSVGVATYGLGVLVMDWDGDGRPDILWATDATNDVGAWQWNRATGDTLTVAQGGVGAMNAPVNTSITTAPPQTAIVDANGDGLPDIVYGDSAGNWHTLLHQGPFPDLVSSVVDGYGNSVSFAYAPLTNSAIYTKGTTAKFPDLDFQAPLYVVSQYVASDGVGGYYRVAEAYTDARFNYQGRGFEGFASRTETDSRTGIITTSNFYQSFPFIGLLASTATTQSDGELISQTVNGYVDLETSATPYSDRHYPYAATVTQTTNEVNPGDPTDGEPVAQVVTSTQVDGYGTPTNITEKTYDLTNGAALVRTVVKSYGTPTNDVANWCLGFVPLETVTNTVPNLASQTRTIQFVKDTNAAQCRVYQKILEPYDPAPYSNLLTTSYAYDGYGHVQTQTVSGAGIANRVTTTNYGTQQGQGVFPLSVTNAAGETTSKTYNYGLGVPLTLTDANGLTVTMQYDSFGRKNKEIKPDGTYTEWSMYACEASNAYCGDSLLRYDIQETLYDAAANVVRYNVQLFDGLVRPKYTQSQTVDGAISNLTTDYDNLGRVRQKSRPFLSGGTVYYTTYAYDILGRMLSESRPINQGNPANQSVNYGYQRLLHTYQDANGNITKKQFNATGQIASIIDPSGATTSYQYDPFGNLLSTKDPAGNQIVTGWSIRGFKTSSADPDMGSWSYQYYPTGELYIQKDAKAQQTTFVYDGIGRMISRSEAEGTTTWNYGNSKTYTASNRNIARVISVASPGGYSEAYAYDALGRPQTNTTTANGTSYVVSSAYDPTSGLLSTVTYPTSTSAVTNSRFKVQYDYAYGMLHDVRDFNTPTLIYWQENSTDAAGHPTSEQFGNGLITASNFDAVTGLIASRTTGSAAQVQNLLYQWDKAGNLLEREDASLNLTETFANYDSLNRFTTSSLNGVQNLAITYDPQGIGNIASKSGVGSYSYAAACGGTAHPHAVTAAGSNTYCYDANGNMTTRNGSALTWYSYNLPKQINQGANYSQFAYGAGRGRYLQVSHVAASGTLPPGTETTVYVNNMFEQVTKPSGVVEYKHYLIVGNAAVAIRTLRTNGVNDCRYLHKDHLGSVDTITDESGNVLQKLSYDAFGARRAAATWAGALSSTDWANIASITHRGFTSHEQLDDVGLIHMNGRVYDPTIGRFVSADPTVQSPYMSQDLNRYSYVINNPLSIVDLSGFGFFSDFWDFLVGFVKFVAPVVIGVVLDLELGPYFSQLLNTAECLAPGTITLGGATLAGGTSAAVSAALGGDGWWGSLKAGLWGAIGAWIGFGVSEGAQTTATDHGGLLDIKHVEPDPDSPFWSEREGIAIADVEGTPTNNTVFVNGMLNNVDQAAAYALKQTGTPIGGDVTLFYNPTHGFVADVTEAIIMKFTGQSALGNELAQILTSGDYQWVVAHSQGTLIVNDALTTLSSAGFTFDNGLSITYFGSAANSLVAQGLSQSVGATFEGAFNSPFDAVGNVLGLNTLNPFRIVGSILAFPSLFTGGVTQHNCYPECAY